MSAIISLLFSGMFFPAHAQFFNLRFDHLTVDQGLSQNSVFCILQDNKGFLWFGTQDGGLNKYDGYDFTIYTHELNNSESIGGNNISKLYEDSGGRIWIGTWGSGLDMYDPVNESFIHYQYSPGCNSCISHNRIQSIVEDDQGFLWIGTAGGGINKFDPETGLFTPFRSSPDSGGGLIHDRIWDLLLDDQGQLWVATDMGICIFSRKQEEFFSIQTIFPKITTPLRKQIRCLEISNNKTVWIGTASGLYKLDTDRDTLNLVPLLSRQITDPAAIEINTLFEDEEGRLWVGTHSNGLIILNSRSEEIFHFVHDPMTETSLSFDDIRDIYRDHSGNLWLATRGGGINKLNLNAKKFHHFSHNPLVSNSLSSNAVWAICEDAEGKIWVGTYGGGLNRLDRSTNKFTHYVNKPGDENTLSDNMVLSLYPGKSGMLWVGTQDGGLNKFDPINESFTVYSSSQNNAGIGDDLVSCLLEVNDLLWIGTDNGLDMLNINTGVFSHFRHDPEDSTSISDNRVWALYKDRNNGLWVGTDNGLNLFDAESQSFRHFFYRQGQSHSISDNDIFCIHQDLSDNMWFGTGKGLNRFDPITGQFERLDTISSFLNGPVYGIIEDNNQNLWITTLKGLIQLDPRNFTLKFYDPSDGLQSNEFIRGSFWKSKHSDEVFIGGINGFNTFFPDQIKENSYIPPVVITQFSLFNHPVSISADGPLKQSISETKEIRLNYKQYDFSFRFVALNFTNSHKNRYKYRLLGYDNEWKESVSDRTATYTNISHGSYQFIVVGSNNDGVWNDLGARVSITITPPFWRTRLFYVACVAALIVLVILVIKIREKRLLREKRVLEKTVAERTEEIVQQKSEIEKKNQEITDSINYAQRIQNAILAEEQDILRLFPESFVVYLPKDIVSGDFYWFGEEKGCHIVAVVDCTGHGVPGAFMSMIGSSLLNQIIHEKGITNPAEILSLLNAGVKHALKQEGSGQQYQDDGMDASVISVSFDQQQLLYAGASMSMLLIHNQSLQKINGDIYSIGGVFGLGYHDSFKTNRIPIHPDDQIYLYSDGFQDQFGGPENQKFMASRFEELILKVSEKSMIEQKQTLLNVLDDWKGRGNQTDDVLIIGLKPST